MAVQMQGYSVENGSGMGSGGTLPDAQVSYIRTEVTALMPKWNMMNDVLEGEEKVKAGKTKYLPKPSEIDTSDDAQTRYSKYIQRAVFYNATRRTLDGLMGQVFSRDPIMELPPELESLKEDCDGAGVSLDQLARVNLSFVMAYGRAGLLVDFPDRGNKLASKADLLSGEVRPNVTLYDPWSVINWRTKLINGKRMLTLVVISENYLVSDDGFETKYSPQWRVMKLVNGVYKVEFWRRETPEASATLYQNYTPKDANGKPFKFIPFTFVGCTNNNEYPDQPPMYDLMTVNLGHYRNSADYEEACFIVGQPTPVFTGLTQQWVNEVMKGQVYLGSRGGVMLPVGGDAKLLQVNANSLPMEAMKHKEAQMVALGAKLVQSKSVQRTLGEAQIDESAESSILATAAKNVSMAIQWALKQACLFVNASQDAVRFSLNTDFPATRLTPNDRAELVLEWQAGAISFTEMRANLRRAGVATMDDKEAQQEIKDNPSPSAQMAQEQLNIDKKQAAAQNSPEAKPPGNASGGGNQAGT